MDELQSLKRDSTHKPKHGTPTVPLLYLTTVIWGVCLWIFRWLLLTFFPHILTSSRLVRHITLRMKPKSRQLSINHLPVEILGEIFMIYIHTFDNDGKGPLFTSLRSRAHPYTLTWVCAHWRAVAISMPMLWSEIAVNNPQKHIIPGIELWLERGGSSPLSITIRHVEVGPKEIDATEEIMLLLFSHSRRWKHLELDLHGAHLSLLDHMSRASLPQLESADLSVKSWTCEEMDELWSYVGASTSMICLRFHRCHHLPLDSLPAHHPILPARPPWLQLTHVTFSHYIPMDVVLNSLQHCVNVEVLDLHELLPMSPTSRSITLGKLRELSVVMRHGDPTFFFDALCLPSLSSLQVGHYLSQNDPRGGLALDRLLTRSSSNLTRLAFHDSKISGEELIYYLSSPALRSVVSLELRTNVNEQALIALTCNINSVCLFPCLELLDVWHLSSWPLLSTMVASRACMSDHKSRQVGSINKLQIVNFYTMDNNEYKYYSLAYKHFIT